MIYVAAKHLLIIQSILSKYPYSFYAYGSRVKGTCRQSSDLDLCYKEPISLAIVSQIEEAFENSDLPFEVDLVDYKSCSSEFKNIIDKDLTKI